MKPLASEDEIPFIDYMDLASVSKIKTTRKCSSRQKHKEVKVQSSIIYDEFDVCSILRPQ